MKTPTPLFIPGSAGEQFGQVLRTRHAGQFLLRESRYRAALRMPMHFHPRAYLSFVVRGSLREHTGRQDHQYETGSLHFHPAGDPHADSMGEVGATCLSIVPLGQAEARLGRAVLPPPPGVAPFSLGLIAGRCHRELRATDSASDLALEALALELVARLLRSPPPRERRMPAWLLEVRDYLHAHAHERIWLAELSALAGVHEAHLVRAFRCHLGATPGAYVRGLRIDHARRALLGSEAPIADLALAAGFSSQAHFTRVFHRLVGATPAAYRRAHGRGRP
jgi:AraC family transcriptional regulator